MKAALEASRAWRFWLPARFNRGNGCPAPALTPLPRGTWFRTVAHVPMNDALETIVPERRARVAAALPLGDAILLVGAGDPIPLPEGSDQTYPFRSHAEYFYLAGRECVGGVMAFDPHDT